MVGPPSAAVWKGMEYEHVAAADAATPLRTSNYDVSTTSIAEWYFVVDPSPRRLEELNLAAWPVECALEAERRRRPRTCQHGQTWPSSSLWRLVWPPRAPHLTSQSELTDRAAFDLAHRPLNDFDSTIADVNRRLATVLEDGAGIGREEFTGARLCTPTPRRSYPSHTPSD